MTIGSEGLDQKKFKGQSRVMKRRQTEEPGYIWKFYKNPVYDFAHQESPIAQWLEHSNRYSGSSWVRKSFSEYLT